MRSNLGTTTLLMTVLAVAAIFAAPAYAQSTGTTTGAPRAKKKVIRLDAITVEGRIQKPQAFYILQRSTLNFDELNRAETFIPKVEKSVEKTAF